MQLVNVQESDLPPDLAALRSLIRERFNGGLTYLQVKTPAGWAGGRHVGGGVFK